MCNICAKAHKSPKKVKLILQEISDAIKGGVDVEHFRDAIDAILGTTMEERDLETEKDWSNNQ